MLPVRADLTNLFDRRHKHPSKKGLGISSLYICLLPKTDDSTARKRPLSLLHGTAIRLGAEQLRFAHGRPGRLQDGRAEAPQPIPPSDRLEKIHPAAINYAWEEAPMRMVLAIAALLSIAFARALGLEVPMSMLIRVDEVIE
jgi:hypothetical protein